MEKHIYDKDGFVQTIIKGDAIHVIWEKLFNAQVIYDSCEAQMKAVKEHKLKAVIIDMVDARGTPPQECQKWFGEVLFPSFKSNPSFKGLINVLPENAITKMGANSWKQTATAEEFGFKVFETASSETAFELLKEL